MLTHVAIKGVLKAALFFENKRPALLLWDSAKSAACRADAMFDLYAQADTEVRFLDGRFADAAALHGPLRDWSAKFAALDHLISGMDADFDEDLRRWHLARAASMRQAAPEVREFTKARLLGCPTVEGALTEDAIRISIKSRLHEEATLFEYAVSATRLGLIEETNAKISALLEATLIQSRDAGVAERSQLEIDQDILDFGFVAAYVEAWLGGDQSVWDTKIFRGFSQFSMFRSQLTTRKFLTTLKQSFVFPKSSPIIAAPSVSDETMIRTAAAELAYFPKTARTIAVWATADATSRMRRPPQPIDVGKALRAAQKQVDFFVQQFEGGRRERADAALAKFIEGQLNSGALHPACQTLSAMATRVGATDSDASLELLDLALQVEDDPVARAGRAETLRELGRPEDALLAYNDAVADFPNDVVARAGRAETLRELGRPEDALLAYNDAVADFPNDVVARNGRAETLRELGRPEDALLAYNDAVADFPNDVVARTGRAETLRELGRPEDALKAYADTAARFPFNRVVKNAWARTLVGLQRMDEAAELLQWQNPVVQQDWRDRYVWATLLHRTGDATAVELVKAAAVDCPFESTRRAFGLLLASVQLRAREIDGAYALVTREIERSHRPSATILAFPLLLRAHCHGERQDLPAMLADLKASETARPTAEIIDLAALMRARFSAADGTLTAEQMDALDRAIITREDALVLDLAA